MKKSTPFAIRTLIVFATFLWILSSVGEAATIQVDCSSASLQAAIEKARPGDTLLVSGTCKENLVIPEDVQNLMEPSKMDELWPSAGLNVPNPKTSHRPHLAAA